MAPNRHNDIPLIPKVPVSLVVLANSDTEATALRSVLEYFDYRVDIHWVGSRKEFIEILKGTIRTEDVVILSCHGDKKGIVMNDEKPVTAKDIGKYCTFKGKTVISVGCTTGSKEYVASFRKKAGCSHYIAPKGYPFGNTALLFCIHVLYELKQHKSSLKSAVKKARGFDRESKMFHLW